MQEDHLSFYEAEKKEIPLDHTEIGGHLAMKWKLPLCLVDTIRYHHTLSEKADDSKLLVIIYLADLIMNTCSNDVNRKIELSAVHPEVLNLLEDEIKNVQDWFPEVFIEIQSACKFFIEEL